MAALTPTGSLRRRCEGGLSAKDCSLERRSWRRRRDAGNRGQVSRPLGGRCSSSWPASSAAERRVDRNHCLGRRPLPDRPGQPLSANPARDQARLRSGAGDCSLDRWRAPHRHGNGERRPALVQELGARRRRWRACQPAAGVLVPADAPDCSEVRQGAPQRSVPQAFGDPHGHGISRAARPSPGDRPNRRRRSFPRCTSSACRTSHGPSRSSSAAPCARRTSSANG